MGWEGSKRQGGAPGAAGRRVRRTVAVEVGEREGADRVHDVDVDERQPVLRDERLRLGAQALEGFAHHVRADLGLLALQDDRHRAADEHGLRHVDARKLVPPRSISLSMAS